MKAVALLLIFVVLAAFPAETSAWRWFRKIAERVKNVVRKVSNGVKKVVNKFKEWKNRHGRRAVTFQRRSHMTRTKKTNLLGLLTETFTLKYLPGRQSLVSLCRHPN